MSAVAVEALGGVTPGLSPRPKGIFRRMRFWTGSTMPLSWSTTSLDPRMYRVLVSCHRRPTKGRLL